MSKIGGLFRNRTVVIIIAAVFVLSAALGIAALTGVFSSGGKTAGTSADMPGSSTGQDSVVDPVKRPSPVDTAVEIKATESDSLGVSPMSSFRLLFSEETDETTVASSLSVEPAQTFSIGKVSGKEFSLTFDKPLQGNSIYNFTLSDKDNGAKKSWAFQTKKQFNVIRTLPRDMGTYVPVNSGIEITFSHDGIENAEEYFEITPKVEGRFEWNKKTLVFIPYDMEYDTVYTVTIKKGLSVKGSDDSLQNDYTFKFQTQPRTESKTYFQFSGNFYNFLPGTVPALEVYTQNDMSDSTVPVTIYRYPDTASFLNALKTAHSMPYWAARSINADYDTGSLETVAAINCTIAKQGEYYWNRYYLLLPTTLQEGYYLVSAEVDGSKYYTPMQINSTSVYIMTTSNKYLAWLNDTVTGQPISGAVFKYEDGKSAVSDSNGLAVFDAPSDVTDASKLFFIVEPKSQLPFVACMPNVGSSSTWYSYYGSDVTDDFWTYLYLDRGVYLPQDTINVWGVIKPRHGADISSEGVLELVRNDWYVPENDNSSVLTSQNITLSPDGTFIGDLRVSNFNPGSYSVRVKIDGRIMLGRYLQIMDYTKPIYTINIEPDRKYMFAWETVNFDITSSFFEGTPAVGMKLDYSSILNYTDPKYGVLTSDSKGKTSLSVTPAMKHEGWMPEMLYFSVSNNEAAEQQTRAYEYVYVFPKDTMVEVASKTENGKGTITFTTSRIDLSGLISRNPGYPTADDYRGESVDIPVKAKLYERHYEKRKIGDYYDYINKVRRDYYEYYEVQNLISEYSFTTAGGKHEIQYNSESGKHYVVEIFAADSKGRTINESTYIYNWDGYDPYNTNVYVLSQSDVFKEYKAGEMVRAEVRYNREEPFTGDNRKYLFVRMRDGIIDYTVTENAIYQFPFDSSFVPNIYVKAMCFDGIGVYNAGINMYRYDSNEKKLDISVTPDKKDYKPGSDVRLSVEVKDGNGRPVSAEVNISVVDEAFFALYGQYADILGGLYGMYVSSGFLSDYISYEPLVDFGPPMAEYGGEGGNDAGVRKDFKDTAVFTTVKTGANGKGETSFRMPDNLTSWRVTSQAFTNDLQAGTKVINVSSKLPFFVDTIFNKVFITGDSPSILVRANGEELQEGSDVDFKVTVTSEDGTSKSYTGKGTANIYSEIQLGSLAQGSYTVRIEGACGNLKDAMERTFRVSDSLLETSVTDIIPLTEEVSMASDVKGLTTLTFYNEDSSVLYNELRSLYWSWGSRLDQVLARKISGKLLQNYFNEERYIEEEFDLQKYQTDDGGLALLTYDSSSPELSAKMCSLAADSIDRNALASYFYGLIEKEKTVPEDVIYAYWGLAALKEPVLLDIRSLLAEEGLDMKTRLALGVALAEAGDYQGAAQIYNEIMAASATVTDMYAWVDAGTRDDSIDATALCTLIAMKTNAPEKMKLFNYIKSNSTSMLLVNMERMIFVTNYVKDASLTNSFTYELDGVKKQIELKKGSYFRLVLTPEKLASIKFSGITGRILAARSYTAPVSQVMKTKGDIVSIKRTYEVAGKKGSVTAFGRSDTIKVILTPQFSENAPDGYYEITDVLPAGLRFTQAQYGDKGISIAPDQSRYYPSEVTGQKVVFGYYYNKKHKDDINSIIYFAKAVSPGTYTADSAALRHTDNEIAGFSPTEQITVSK